MTKLGSIDFDDRILDAMRDDQLVVFAGAGVSKGPPSDLDDFKELCRKIAEGTGRKSPEPPEPLDRFLGKLEKDNVKVHERAVEALLRKGSRPKDLHRDLMRLFQTNDRVRLVTTNFDLLFEAAAESLFDGVPDVYRAPALPLGHDFNGIVHVHGALPRARELVLTDSDFGRAYLTEGWARRFLVDVFRSYTVLFVGYSHDDTVMHYLARALPPDNVKARFALTHEDGSWELLGITPVRFVKGEGEDSYGQLYDGVRELADRSARGALDWQSRLAELGDRAPPMDEEAVGEIEQALREVYTTRFLLEVVRDPTWVQWLNRRKYLDALFGNTDLNERDRLFAGWLAEHFAIEHPHEVFDIVASHELRMNRTLWWMIVRQIRIGMKATPLEEPALKRWISILLATAPADGDRLLEWLAECCAEHGCVELTLKVFLAMSEHRLNVSLGFPWPHDDGQEHGRPMHVECPLRSDQPGLKDVWTDALKPHLGLIAQPLLSGVVWRLEKMHSELAAWDKASREWDPTSFGRSAIEPHGQDEHPRDLDVLVDAARDALEWLATDSPRLLTGWIERLVNSEAPLPRRLAIHAMTVHPEYSHEERLNWLLDRFSLDARAEHHEIHRAVALSYAVVDDSIRGTVVEAVLTIKREAVEDDSAEARTARWRFDWLSWLLQAKGDCEIAGRALAPLKAAYSDWLPSDYPDFTHWSWSGASDLASDRSPWSVEELLATAPHERLDELLNFKGKFLEEPSREGLLMNVGEACKQESGWAFALGQALSDRKEWESDLWPTLIHGLMESEMTRDEWREALTLASSPGLQDAQAHGVVDLLFGLVRDGGKPFAIDLLERANALASQLWDNLESGAQGAEGAKDWLFLAFNHPFGILVRFWISGLSLLMRGKDGAERTMPREYRERFTLVVQDATSKGGTGRCLLASQTGFLFSLDEDWTREYIVPLFSDSDRQKFAQVWDGVLVCGRLSPGLIEALKPATLTALQSYAIGQSERRRRFIKFYTNLCVFHLSDPRKEFLPALFEEGSVDDRVAFASHIGYLLRRMNDSARQQLWKRWLCKYCRDRSDGVLAPLDGSEIPEMLDWLPSLGVAFPDAVNIVVERFPKEFPIDHVHAVPELRESDLVTRYPEEMAEFLIYLSRGVSLQKDGLAEIEARLPEIPEELRKRLNEAFARAGIRRRRD